MINVYSKSDSQLGRLLSNFAHTPFVGGEHKIQSVEGWWYWYTTGKQHHYLLSLYGFKAKQEGKKHTRVTEVRPHVLKNVYLCKLEHNPHIRDMLVKYNGHFDHYYVYNDRIVRPTQHLWTVKLWEEIRDELVASA